MTRSKILINKLPFFWRLRDSLNQQNVVPDFMPFEFDYDEHLNLIIQKRNNNTRKYLKKIYQENFNIGNIQESGYWSTDYADDFIRFLNFSISNRTSKVTSILELGCGGCVLLKILKDQGYKVVGIDPSRFAVKAGRKRGVKVIQDFFPTKELREKFDLIFHSDLIEHVTEPVEFLKLQRRQLKADGILVVATPDCTESITRGDISMILHQHWNYFDKESLENTVKEAGFYNIHIEKAKYGGNLYCFAEKTRKPKKVGSKTDFKKDKYLRFSSKQIRLTASLKRYVDKRISDERKTLGFYAPVRAFPYLAGMNLYQGFRFFDDNSYWHLKYFDGIGVTVENFNDLRKNPPTNLIIMSPTFGDDIEQRIVKYFSGKIKTKKLTDFFE